MAFKFRSFKSVKSTGQSPQKLIVGLGNPGPQYAGTRHNIGFEWIDSLAQELGTSLKEHRHRSVFGFAEIENVCIGLVKPLTYMNLSGGAIAEISKKYNISPENILVIADDLDLPVGKIRFRTGGGAGGHNGHRSLIQSLKTEQYPRLKIGIGKPIGQEVSDYVLSRFTPQEKTLLEDILKKSQGFISSWVQHGSIQI